MILYKDDILNRYYYCYKCKNYGIKWKQKELSYLNPVRVNFNVYCSQCDTYHEVDISIINNLYKNRSFHYTMLDWIYVNKSLEQDIINYCNNFKIKI